MKYKQQLHRFIRKSCIQGLQQGTYSCFQHHDGCSCKLYRLEYQRCFCSMSRSCLELSSCYIGPLLHRRFRWHRSGSLGCRLGRCLRCNQEYCHCITDWICILRKHLLSCILNRRELRTMHHQGSSHRLLMQYYIVVQFHCSRYLRNRPHKLRLSCCKLEYFLSKQSCLMSKAYTHQIQYHIQVQFHCTRNYLYKLVHKLLLFCRICFHFHIENQQCRPHKLLKLYCRREFFLYKLQYLQSMPYNFHLLSKQELFLNILTYQLNNLSSCHQYHKQVQFLYNLMVSMCNSNTILSTANTLEQLKYILIPQPSILYTYLRRKRALLQSNHHLKCIDQYIRPSKYYKFEYQSIMNPQYSYCKLLQLDRQVQYLHNRYYQQYMRHRHCSSRLECYLSSQS